ncbi:hypothetical protein MAUB1S_08131 [Mycolicibacterium aubagnense]
MVRNTVTAPNSNVARQLRSSVFDWKMPRQTNQSTARIQIPAAQPLHHCQSLDPGGLSIGAGILTSVARCLHVALSFTHRYQRA